MFRPRYAFSVQIVAIGQGIDEDSVMQLLESCVVQDLASCYPLPSACQIA